MPDFDFNFQAPKEIPVEKMRPGKNVRTDANEAEIPPLGESLLVRQLLPVILDPEYFIIDGWRRWLAAQKVGIKTLWAIITDRQLTRKELQIAQLMMSVHRCDLTGGDLYTACYQLLQLHSGWMAKDLAQQLKVSPSMMTRILSPSKCIEPVRKALMENRIGLSHCYEISKAGDDDTAQLTMLEQVLEGGVSRDELGRQRRKKSRSGGGAGRMQTVRCELAGGVVITIAAESLSMQVIVQALTDALKGAKKSAEEQHSVKTWELRMHDEAKRKNSGSSAA